MKKKIAALSFSLIFFGTIAFSGLAMPTGLTDTNQVIDNDKDKKAKKSKKGECKHEKSCCDYKSVDKSCDDKGKKKDDK